MFWSTKETFLLVFVWHLFFCEHPVWRFADVDFVHCIVGENLRQKTVMLRTVMLMMFMRRMVMLMMRLNEEIDGDDDWFNFSITKKHV